MVAGEGDSGRSAGDGGRRRRWRVMAAVGVVVGLVAVAGGLWRLDALGAGGPREGVRVEGNAPATANQLHAPRAHNSPELAIDPADGRVAALAYRTDNPDFSCGLALSGDGGASWTDADPVAALPEGVDHCYAPQVAFDAEGTLYFLFVGLAGQGNTPQGVWLTTSPDRGRTFARPHQVLGAGNYQVRLAIDHTMDEAGRLHLAWLEVAGEPTTGGLPPTDNPITTAYSTDGGASFSDPIEVSGSERRRVVAPALAVGAAGEVHLAYYDLEGDVRDYQGLEGPVWADTWSIETVRSADGGASFSDPTVVDDGVVPAGRVPLIFTMPPPGLAADGDGTVYTAWHDARQGTSDVWVARSGDGGRTWADPTTLGDPTGDTRWPQLAVAPDGRVELAAVDYDGEERYQVAYAASPDRGRTFGSREHVTSEASDAHTGPRFHLPVAQGHVEFGTGVALHAGADRALAAWPDTRHAVPTTAHQDLYTARLTRDATPPPWTILALAGLAAVAAVGLGAVAWHRRRKRSVATGAALLLGVVGVGVLAGCDSDPPAARPDAPPTITVGMDEYAFDAPDSVSAGRVTVEVANHGDQAHELVLVPLPADTALADLLASPDPVALPPEYVVSPRQPGESAAFTVDLDPGRYGLVCFLPDPEGTPHHQRGMHAEVTVDR